MLHEVSLEVEVEVEERRGGYEAMKLWTRYAVRAAYSIRCYYLLIYLSTYLLIFLLIYSFIGILEVEV